MSHLRVLKRDGSLQLVDIGKIQRRIEILAGKRGGTQFTNLDVDVGGIASKVSAGLYDGVTTEQLDNLAAEIAASRVTHGSAYAELAARIAVSNLHKKTPNTMLEVAQTLYNAKDPKTGEHTPVISKELFDAVQRHASKIEAAINYQRDYGYSFFGLRTLERSYLLRVRTLRDGKIDTKIVERPQHMLMRVAVSLYCTGGVDNIQKALEVYENMSMRYYTHATPTLFNAGTNNTQLSSCFLLHMKDDSIDGIFSTLHDCARISKCAGGIGLAVHNIRATGAHIRGTNGTSNGLVPMLRVFNSASCYVDQGGNKRPGSIAIYLEPWHADIFEFLELRNNQGREQDRARDLFYALWIPDLFMKRVKANAQWSLFSPDSAPGLFELHGEAFERKYTEYEERGLAYKTVPAVALWKAIISAQIETGMPYMLYKDACNAKSNQSNLGTIKSSNLCAEVVQFTDAKNTAVCNLASIALPSFYDASLGAFDFDKLAAVTRQLVENLNRVIDLNYYPTPEAEHSNRSLRPIGIGIQGLADLFAMMRLPYGSPEALKLDRDIMETIYFSALWESCSLAERDGPYEYYEGSPASRGILQPDMWGERLEGSRWGWSALRQRIAKHGLRNSLLTALMPTASTSQILGFNESFEPFTSNMYTRRVLSGEFVVVNKYLIEDLLRLDMWNEPMRQAIIACNGSIQYIKTIPDDVKKLYRTAWELSQRVIIDHARARAPFVDQSQSMNLYMENPSFEKLTSMHFYAYNSGLKTGMYYLRSRPAVDPIKFTIDASLYEHLIDASSMKGHSKDVERYVHRSKDDERYVHHREKGSAARDVDAPACSRDNPDCMMCSA